jgi:hypothetical protein
VFFQKILHQIMPKRTDINNILSSGRDASSIVPTRLCVLKDTGSPLSLPATLERVFSKGE